MIEENPNNIRHVTWHGRRYCIVPMHPYPGRAKNLYTLEMDNGSDTKVVVDLDDRQLKTGVMYAYLTKEKMILWDCGDGKPPDGKIVGSVIKIIYAI
jgi:hypothetical protein